MFRIGVNRSGPRFIADLVVASLDQLEAHTFDNLVPPSSGRQGRFRVLVLRQMRRQTPCIMVSPKRRAIKERDATRKTAKGSSRCQPRTRETRIGAYTFGNVSGISRSDGMVAIKPSGVPYESMKADDIVITDLEGQLIEGSLRLSSDLATHLELYKAFPSIGGVSHTHSEFATAWAQARKPIPCFGTTQGITFMAPCR